MTVWLLLYRIIIIIDLLLLLLDRQNYLISCHDLSDVKNSVQVYQERYNLLYMKCA